MDDSVGKYRELQRLTVQYAKILDLNLEESAVDAESMDVET
jgi:protein HIRA/HIR1